ncbi:MAG: Dabb family protein [Vicinamibacterales bacterium]
MLQHYVFLKYREGTTDGHVVAFCERMFALRDTIGGIEHLEIGRDELHDERSWDLVLIMEFASAEALRAYQRHRDHLAVMAFNDPFVANVASVDFTRHAERGPRDEP